MIRVCIVEDQTLVREGLRSLLGMVDGVEVVAEAEDGEAALRIIPEVHPDVVLLDVRMPGKSGIEVLAGLGGSGWLPPTLILTTFDDDAVLLEGLKAGAKGFLLKDVSLACLAEAIRTLAAGGDLILPALTEHLGRGREWPGTDFDCLESPDPLTEREIEVLRLLARGYSNREIGDALDIAEGTVKNHISHILSKLGVRDRTRAVLKALELELI
ncbi:MAG TPA: response regulator transcription factor [Thermoanaerobaculia bacterium]